MLILIAWMFAGCASGPPPTPVTFQRLPPPSLVAPCAPPPPAPATFRGADLLANHVEAMRAYHDCRAKHRDLAEWARNPTRAAD